MVEFALALPVLLLVIYGLLETGRLLFMYASVVSAARQAARYGSATGDNGSGTKYYDDCDGIMAAARRLEFIQRFSNISVGFDGPNWSYSGCPIPHTGNPDINVGHPANGDRIRVSVSSVFTPIVPLVPFRPFTITSTSNRTLLVGSYIAVEHASEGYIGSGTQGFVLTKWANTDYYYHIGDVITYHYTIQNTGTTPIPGGFWILDDRIPHSDPRGNPCTGAPSPLPGPSAVITCPDQTYTITAADITSPEVTNHARASNDGGSMYSNQAVYTVTFVPQPHIALAKVGQSPNPVDAGKDVVYTFTITNDGNMPLRPPYTINDSLIGKNWSCPSTPDPLAVGGQVACTGTYTLSNRDIDQAFVTNTASATAMAGAATVTSASVTVQTPIPLLLLDENPTISPNPYSSLAQTITFTYSFHNRGTKKLTGLSFTSNLIRNGGATVACPSEIAAGGDGTCKVTYSVTQPDMDAGTIFDTASMQGTQSSPSKTWTSNIVNVSVPGSQLGGVEITMEPAPSQPSGTSFLTGQVINYSFTFRNSGNVTLKGPYTITVDDKRIGSFTCTSTTGTLAVNAPVDTVICPIKPLTLTDADIAAGRLITNAAGTAVANVGATLVTPGSATATVITYTLPRITLAKTPSKPNFMSAGDGITYTYGLKNTGGVEDLTVTPFTLVDNKLGPISCPAGTIAVGQTLVCGTLNYTATDADVAALKITNTISVDPSNTGTGVGASSGTPATVVTPPEVVVPLLRCDSTTLTSTKIPDGSNVDWYITNKTGLELHVTGGWMRWSDQTPVLLQGIIMSGQQVSASGASILLLPSSGWQPITYDPNNLDAQTHLVLKFSGTAANIQVYLTFQETFNGLTCTLQSPQLP